MTTTALPAPELPAGTVPVALPRTGTALPRTGADLADLAAAGLALLLAGAASLWRSRRAVG